MLNFIFWWLVGKLARLALLLWKEGDHRLGLLLWKECGHHFWLWSWLPTAAQSHVMLYLPLEKLEAARRSL